MIGTQILSMNAVTRTLAHLLEMFYAMLDASFIYRHHLTLTQYDHSVLAHSVETVGKVLRCR